MKGFVEGTGALVRWQDELVPDWFVDDGCSLSPDWWWGICGRYHDWYYSPWSRCPSRLEADREFARRLVRATGSFVVPMIYYIGVRLGGFRAWKRDNHGNASRVPPDWKGPEHLRLECWD